MAGKNNNRASAETARQRTQYPCLYTRIRVHKRPDVAHVVLLYLITAWTNRSYGFYVTAHTTFLFHCRNKTAKTSICILYFRETLNYLPHF